MFLIGGFNYACNNIAASYLKVGCDSMSDIRSRTRAKGSLPHLSYIFRKPDPMWTEFKTVVYYVKDALICVEVKKLK